MRSSAGPATMTRPSAGDTTRPSTLRNLTIGIAEEVGEESAEQRERSGPPVPAGGSEASRRYDGGGNERKPGAIDLHRREC